jgi:hypothetical protein
MSKIITSPIKRWPGTVTLADPLTFPQYIRLKDALQEAEAQKNDGDRYTSAVLLGVCACVEEWELAGLGQLTPETFPATPRVSAGNLFNWLMSEIVALLTGGEEVAPV